jgi:peptidoglycan/LPS O-acetylase OafA/YrhL
MYQPSHTRFGAFVCGVIAAQIARGGRTPRRPRLWLAAALALIAALIALPAFDPQSSWPHAAGLAYLALFPTAFAAAASVLLLYVVFWGGEGRLRRALSARAFHPIAQLSYGAFLFNPLLIFAAYFTVLDLPHFSFAQRLGCIAGFTAATLAFSFIIYMAVERPFIRLRPDA